LSEWNVSVVVAVVLEFLGLFAGLIISWTYMKARINKLEEQMTAMPKKEDMAIVVQRVSEMWNWWQHQLARRARRDDES
jgi:hypothetical protein